MSLRVFIDADTQAEPGHSLRLNAEESHYLLRVRRAKVGSRCEVLDRRGGRFQATVRGADARSCELDIEAQLPERAALLGRELWLGIPDASALLAAISRATELGATDLLFLESDYAQSRLPSSPRIARCLDAAMRQCGRSRAPRLHGSFSIDAALARPWSGEISWLTAPASGESSLSADRRAKSMRIAIGPEGGFSPQEVVQFQEAGFSALELGPYILRSEVAVTAALARLHT